MSSSNQGRSNRARGHAMERELCVLLSQHLGLDVRRALGQSRDGGDDAEGVPGWAIESKYRKQLARPTWWAQVCTAAGDRRPALFYRLPRQRGASLESAWVAVLPVDVVPPMQAETVRGPRLGVVMPFVAAVSVIGSTL